MAIKTNVLVDGIPVPVTNLTKVLWPGDGYPKGDLIAYYREIADFILPYLKNRPQTLHRHPNGIDGQNFFMNDMSRQPPPDWVTTVPIWMEGEQKEVRFLVCQNQATLVYQANLACIELNPWHAQISSLDMADYAMLDLDPEDISFTQVVEVAQSIRKLLEKADVECFCKTSGKRGLHVYIPLGGRYAHEQAKQFAELLAQIVNRLLPRITSLVRLPSGRQQRVYLDWLQNGRGKTLVVAYSVRPNPGATVSTPLKWSEVTKRLDPTKYTIKTMPSRLEKHGDLWKPVLGKGIDLHKCLDRLASAMGKPS
jgi:bifunctional non-homologous end joining protein LigD